MDAIMLAKAKAKMHGQHKSEIIQRQADGCGSKTDSFLTMPSGMPKDNPFKSDKQRKFLWKNKPTVAKKFSLHTKKDM